MKYKIEQQATVWYGTTVEANSLEEALDLAIEDLEAGNGTENPDSFEFADEYWIQDENGTVHKTPEGY